MNPNVFLLWLEVINSFAMAVAKSEGKDERALSYLDTATKLGRAGVATADDLAELKAKYDEEVANDTPTTASELDAIAARIKARSEAIQSS